MQKIYINYANQDFVIQQQKNTHEAKTIGHVDKVIAYSPCDIDTDFYTKHKKILNKTRGAGYWLWKFYIVYKTLLRDDVAYGDVVFYADSGTKILKDLTPVFSMPAHYNQDIILFSSGEVCNQRIKKDAFILMDCNTPDAHTAPMVAGGFHIWRKSPESIQFIETCLKYATNYQIISDSRSKLGKELPEFTMHRHDQAVFSLVAYKQNISLVCMSHVYGYEQNRIPPDTFLQSERMANRNKWRRLRYKIAMLPEKFWKYGGIWAYIKRQFSTKK